MKKAILYLVAGTLLLFPVIALAKLASFDFQEMIHAAHTVVIGHVESISKDNDNTTQATIRVSEVLKGNPGSIFVIDIDRTWACDTSEAKTGERILLFTLKTNAGRQIIYASGRGRMPIDSIDGTEYATFWDEVRIPKSIRTVKGPEPEYDFIRRANLSDMKKYIESILQ